MDWQPLARGVLLYGVAAAGLSVALVALVTGSEPALFALMLGGLVCLLFAFGVRDVRPNHVGPGAGGDVPRVDARFRRQLPTDLILACYGVGLAVLSFAGMGVIAG